MTKALQKHNPYATIQSASASMLTNAKQTAKQEYLAVAFLLAADRNRYGILIQDLENEFTQGVDKYPKTLTDAYYLLLNWKHDPKYLMNMLGSTEQGVALIIRDVSHWGRNQSLSFMFIGSYICLYIVFTYLSTRAHTEIKTDAPKQISLTKL